MLELQSVTKLYGRVIGVNDISFQLPPGAYGLLGPNGSGKSTLLNLITGQLKPTIGRVLVYGKSPRNNMSFFSRLGYCPGSEGLYANVSGLKWVTYLQRLQGATASEAQETASEALELVGMGASMHRPIAHYSRGMRQRTKLAQAIAHDPEVLILDEPFSGLDPVGRHEMTTVLHRWIERGKSLLLSSHILHEVESLTESFLLICGGRLLASGTAAEVHQLLTDLPNEVTLLSENVHRLAEFIVKEQLADTIQINGDRVSVTTRHPLRLMNRLPQLFQESGIVVTELTSGDESLQELFNTIMKIHRGEL